MKYVKMLGLAAVTAMALMAFVGVGTASATSGALCKVTEAPCAAGNQYPAGTKIKAHLVAGTKAVLTGNLEVACEESTVEGEITQSTGSPQSADITALTFTKNCTNCPTVKAEGLPYAATVTGESAGTGNLTVGKATVKLSGCFGFATCTATATNATLHVSEGPSPNQATPRIKATNVPVSLSGFGCGTLGTWNAEYEVTTPDPVYIST